jgi:hypothetical protein
MSSRARRKAHARKRSTHWPKPSDYYGRIDHETSRSAIENALRLADGLLKRNPESEAC